MNGLDVVVLNSIYAMEKGAIKDNSISYWGESVTGTVVRVKLG
jgi:hypothetical protein